MISKTFVLSTGLFFSSSLLFSQPFFKLGDKTYQQDDLAPAIKQLQFESDQMHYNQMEKIAEQALLDDHVQTESKKQNKPAEQIQKDLFIFPPIKEEEAKKWYETNKTKLAGRDYTAIKNEIITYLNHQKQEEARKQLIERLKKEKKFALLIPKPEAPTMAINTDGYPSKGGSKPKVTIVEFADYTCPHCKTAAGYLKQIASEFGDQVKMVFIDFPLNLATPSVIVAQGAFCANKQNKFWEYHYEAFDAQETLNKDTPLQLAKKLKLDEKQFESCMNDTASKDKILSARKQGEALGITGTPAIYINGKKFHTYEFNDLAAEVTRLAKK